jgi:protein phosphatase PTC7|eukprot:CAMPEP_0169108306 /NCGR_PEP_ID=MMETSP1015-20121227/25357_1 /TAXON_ID=342587 /ORGANISM="Karlodinium micrum, Strain CCMP2283" /LENGTH=447 /DNA_ID=CAMNT_0009169919 /DNA_START=40 /DNA_END=1383 /DNA_ORIENTATION=-
MANQGIGRSPTFVVGSDRQRGTLDSLVKREQHFAEAYQKNKPLCFNSKSYQKTHPLKQEKGQKDADATLCSPMLIGIADGVSQIEEFGIDASELPNELLNAVEELAVNQLLPGQETDEYLGPISMMRDAYDSTESLGSTTVLTAIMDNSTKIHGKLHPMVAVCSIGDCEILILRRSNKEATFQTVFHTEMQRIDGNAQSPLQLARVDETVDPDFDPSVAIEVIERGSAVHCVSAFEGDIVILGSDGVFDNLFIDEIVSICDASMPPKSSTSKFKPVSRRVLGDVARQIVYASHSKTQMINGAYMDTPIGRGGKIDDTSCVVSEVVEWTEEHGEAWANLRKQRWWRGVMTCGGSLPTCEEEVVVTDYEYDGGLGTKVRNYPARLNASFTTGVGSEYGGSFEVNKNEGVRGPTMPIVTGYEKQQVARYREARTRRPRAEEEEENRCSIM